MSKDETVDGPKIAAQILNAMQPERKARIVKAMTATDPQITSKVEENLFNFNDLLELTPQSMQLLLQEVNRRDLVLALKLAEETVSDFIYNNMSPRRAQMVKEDFEALPAIKLSEVQFAQRRIMEQVDELRAAGKLRTQSSNDVWV